MKQRTLFCLLLTVLVVFSGCSASPATKNPSSEKAMVESVEVTPPERFALQAQVVAKGNFKNGCEYIDDVQTKREGKSFMVTLTTATKEDAEVCTQAMVPFEKLIRLEVKGLATGTYTVDVNGTAQTFELPSGE